jgi:hypothetical protein
MHQNIQGLSLVPGNDAQRSRASSLHHDWNVLFKMPELHPFFDVTHSGIVDRDRFL